MPAIYNAPPGAASTIGTQINTHHYDRKALIDAVRHAHFGPLASAKNMPKNYGKTMKAFYYVPLLDDRNINDQGLDAAGATLVGGNLYGSSKDIGTIASKLPILSETGGRVNRVGFHRIERTGTLEDFGFFTEFTQDSFDFDTDAELYSHISREMVIGANQMVEDMLQSDLLNAAGTIMYTGAATNDITTTPEGVDPSVVTHEDLLRLSIALDNNRTPMQTTIIKGSRLTDTMTLNKGRIMYIGSELQIMITSLFDSMGNAAFIPVSKYAAAANIMYGEIGSIANFRVVVVQEMQFWEGAGAAEGTNPGYAATGGNYDIFPMLVVGDNAFATIGFQTDKKGKSKFKIIVKKPGMEMATTTDPYGKLGFSSIQFFYGFMELRPERIGLIKTTAPV